MSVSPSEIRTAVKKDDDFGHEMRVGHVIRSCSAIKAQHGGTYTDPVTQKPRQFDYRCWLRKGQASLSMAVECKNLNPSIALAVCGTKRRDDEAFHDLIESRTGRHERRSAVFVGLSFVTHRASREDALYHPKEFVGKSLVRIQTDKVPMVRTPDSDIYDKWAQALSSGMELVEVARRAAKDCSATQFFTAVLPVVVVPDDLLWKVAYDDDGNITADPVQVTECELFVGKAVEFSVGTPSFQGFVFSHVHFFTLKGFDSFVSRMAINDLAWANLFTVKAREI